MEGLLDPQIVGMLIGVVISLMIFSYLLGDNILYRWALALLVGSSVGYALGMAWLFILRDWFSIILGAGTASVLERIVYVAPLILGVLLLLKGLVNIKSMRQIALLGNISIGYLLGVGSGVAISGALTGTLIPQMLATGNAVSLNQPPDRLLMGVSAMIGTIASLIVFSPRQKPQNKSLQVLWRGMTWVGRLFITLALAVVFSGAITTAMTLLIDHIWQIIAFIEELIPLIGG
ncbi:MAG: hypothetical protein GVY30_11090 [Chloroflexi bacterium]|nr:hypothetical protein [Chloroflexota bacterium]